MEQNCRAPAKGVRIMLQVDESWEEFSRQCRKDQYPGGQCVCGVTTTSDCLQATCPRLSTIYPPPQRREEPMKQNLNFKIECGEKTCASEPGKFCNFFGATHFGQRAVCRLFPSEEGSHTKLEEKDGWMQRCIMCVQNSKYCSADLL
jgi:hypothetical protein